MLRKFAAALLATALVAGPAFAQSNGNAGSTPAVPAAQPAAKSQSGAMGASPSTNATTNVGTKAGGQAATAGKSSKIVKHSKHARKHVVRGKSGSMHQARHGKGAKTHQAKVTKPITRADGSRPRA